MSDWLYQVRIRVSENLSKSLRSGNHTNLAQKLDKKLVISTATVNLQEQVYLKDLPDVQDHAGLEFIYDLVKGRGRYL